MAVAVSFYESFNNFKNLLLLVAWKLGNFFKGLTGFADGAVAMRVFTQTPQEMFNGNMKNISKLGNVFRAQGNGAAFPICISWLGDL